MSSSATPSDAYEQQTANNSIYPSPSFVEHPAIDDIVANNIRRLQYLNSELKSASTFKRAALELGRWCKDQRAYMKETEDVLHMCMRTIRLVSPQKGYNLLLGWYVLRIVYAYISLFTDHSHAEDLKKWFKELSKMVLIYKDNMRPLSTSLKPSCMEDKGILQDIYGEVISREDKCITPITPVFNPELMDPKGMFMELPVDERMISFSWPHGTTEVTFEFEISDEQMMMIKEGKRAIKLFACHKDNINDSLPPIEWPTDLHVVTNDQMFMVERKHMVHVKLDNKIAVYGTDNPLVMSSVVKTGKNMLMLNAKQCCCNYIFVIQMFEPLSIEQVAATISSKRIPEDESLKLVKENQDVPLICPFTNVRMVIPVRVATENDIRCFDLLGFLMHNRYALNLLSPYTNEKIELHSLVIDSLLEKILTSSDPSLTSVVIHSDGTFDASNPKEISTPNFNQAKKFRMDLSVETGMSSEIGSIEPPTAHVVNSIMTPGTEVILQAQQDMFDQEQKDPALGYL